MSFLPLHFAQGSAHREETRGSIWSSERSTEEGRAFAPRVGFCWLGRCNISPAGVQASPGCGSASDENQLGVWVSGRPRTLNGSLKNNYLMLTNHLEADLRSCEFVSMIVADAGRLGVDGEGDASLWVAAPGVTLLPFIMLS